MCWSTKYLPIRETASCSLIVYKVVEYITPLRCRSLFMWFEYIYKHEYIELNLNISEHIGIYKWEIYRGFHSFSSLDKAVTEYKDAAAFSGKRVALVECIIPKDSTFYKNEFDEIVSDRIIVNRILTSTAKLPCAWTIIILFIIILLSCFILFKIFCS